MITLKCTTCKSVLVIEVCSGYSEPLDGHSGYCLVCHGHQTFEQVHSGGGGGGGSAHAEGAQSTLNVTPAFNVSRMTVEQLLVPAGAKLEINIHVEKQVVVREDTLDMADVDFAVHMKRKREISKGDDDDNGDGGSASDNPSTTDE